MYGHRMNRNILENKAKLFAGLFNMRFDPYGRDKPCLFLESYNRGYNCRKYRLVKLTVGGCHSCVFGNDWRTAREMYLSMDFAMYALNFSNMR